MIPFERAKSTLLTLAQRVLERIESDPWWPAYSLRHSGDSALVSGAHQSFDDPQAILSEQDVARGWRLLEGLIATHARLDSHRLLTPAMPDPDAEAAGVTPSGRGP